MSYRKPIQYLVKFLDTVPLLSDRVFGEPGGSVAQVRVTVRFKISFYLVSSASTARRLTLCFYKS
jgi:hypothetical protein